MVQWYLLDVEALPKCVQQSAIRYNTLSKSKREQKQRIIEADFKLQNERRICDDIEFQAVEIFKNILFEIGNDGIQYVDADKYDL